MRGLSLVLNNPSRQAFIFQMVGREELPNAIALNSSLANATRILGPGIGGILIASFGVGVCFAIDALSYVAVIIALLLMRVDPNGTVTEVGQLPQFDSNYGRLRAVRPGPDGALYVTTSNGDDDKVLRVAPAT